MRSNHGETLSLGDVVAAAYDRMLILTGSPKRAGQLTASSVGRLLARAGNGPLVRRISGVFPKRGTRS
jgi:hypothetical protein